MEPRFNEVPIDWGNVFVISRELYRKPRFNEFLGKQLKYSLNRGSLYRGSVPYILL